MVAYKDIGAAFDAVADDYDAGRRALVPGFDGFYGTVVDLVPFGPDDRFSVLDLGAGTGLLAGLVQDLFPKAKLTLIDVAPAMIERAAERFARLGRSAELVVADYTAAPLGGPYDIVVSALSIHHCEDADKQSVFRAVFDALVPGGVFVNAEQVAGPTPALDGAYHARWLDQVRAAGASEDTIAAALDRMAFDRCVPLDRQMGWLRDLGFADVDCWFKAGRFAVYAGTRPRDIRRDP
jgi:tRNA (cmo5U34)-methyltransferase